MKKELSRSNPKVKYPIFAKRLTSSLRSIGVEPTPIAFTKAFNNSHTSTRLKPHTVRKWLLGMTQPRSETLLLLTKWLNVDTDSLFKNNSEQVKKSSAFQFDFLDQEVISKYLSMNFKQKSAVNLLIDTILDKSE